MCLFNICILVQYFSVSDIAVGNTITSMWCSNFVLTRSTAYFKKELCSDLIQKMLKNIDTQYELYASIGIKLWIPDNFLITDRFKSEFLFVLKWIKPRRKWLWFISTFRQTALYIVISCVLNVQSLRWSNME